MYCRTLLALASSMIVVSMISLSTASADIINPLSYTYSTGPWQYWDDSGHDLLDGVLATPITGDPTWVGFGGSGVIDFDFGSSQQLDTIRIHAFDRHGGAGIQLPDSIWVATSSDGINYSSFDQYGIMDWQIIDGGEQGETGWINTNLSLESRFVRVALIPTGSWIFVSEFEFHNTVPAPASLMAFALGAVAWRRRRRCP